MSAGFKSVGSAITVPTGPPQGRMAMLAWCVAGKTAPETEKTGLKFLSLHNGISWK